MVDAEVLDAVGPASGSEPVSLDLRRSIVDAVLGRGGEELAAALDDFFGEDDRTAGLARWFSEEQLARIEPSRISAMLMRDIAAIDALIGDQVDEILHAPEFKRMEAAWRGVDLLLAETDDDEKIRLRLFNATWLELSRDFDRSIEFDQSTLFAKIYNEEYGMPGGVPYGLLVCDYAVRHRFSSGSGPVTDDVSTLSSIAQVAAAAFSPCVIGAAPELFGVSTFADLSYSQRLDTSFRLVEYQRWRKLREREESRFVGIALPRILLRDRYRDSAVREDGFRYIEGGTGVDSWLWGNAAFGFGVVAIRAFKEWGWFADVCGTRGDSNRGGVISDLPSPDFSTVEAAGYRRPLEVELTDKKQKALEDLGFISFSPCNFTRSVVMLGAQSLHLPTDEGDVAERANDRLSSMLQYVMCISRFAHYVKVMARDRVGAYSTPQDLERYLAEWLRNYTIGNTDAGPELKARYPLSGAQLEVRETPGRPGSMNCVMHLQPHFQFDQVVSGFKMRTEIQAARVR
ncbi:type VI secretion system contractile sheath large subunit [Rhizobium sp. LjRoot30]|uniref:type VI secretion system contractile sheath large subunit n=1 Tax=Rhizobium sp. LjRoot30 TaxID=3342320 RepID=UPI003ED130A4